jgi:hypothetical protein
MILYLYTWITAACTGRNLALYTLPVLSGVYGFADGVTTHSVFAGVLRGALTFMALHLLVRGVRHLYSLPVVALVALLLVGRAEAVEQWTVWSVQNDGTAVRVGREVVAGQMVHHDGTEAECWVMAVEFQKSHWFVVADINKARAQRGEPSIKPRVTYECRRAR